MIATKDFKQLLFVSILKTVWFNFRFFPLKEAFRLPVLLARRVQIRHCYRGFCKFQGGVRTGVLRFGFGDRRFNADTKSAISINGKLVLKGNGVHAFGPGTTFSIGPNGILTIGNNFTASVRNRIACNCCITIGDDNMWSFDNVVMDTDAHLICDEHDSIINYNKPIVFGNHVWLGCRNVVMKGSEIPNGCMVASGSKITGKYTEPNCIITSGKKIIKTNIHWKRDWAKNDNI